MSSSIAAIFAFFHEIQYDRCSPFCICRGKSWDHRRRPIHGGYPGLHWLIIKAHRKFHRDGRSSVEVISVDFFVIRI